MDLPAQVAHGLNRDKRPAQEEIERPRIGQVKKESDLSCLCGVGQ